MMSVIIMVMVPRSQLFRCKSLIKRTFIFTHNNNFCTFDMMSVGSSDLMFVKFYNRYLPLHLMKFKIFSYLSTRQSFLGMKKFQTLFHVSLTLPLTVMLDRFLLQYTHAIIDKDKGFFLFQNHPT